MTSTTAASEKTPPAAISADLAGIVDYNEAHAVAIAALDARITAAVADGDAVAAAALRAEVDGLSVAVAVEVLGNQRGALGRAEAELAAVEGEVNQARAALDQARIAADELRRQAHAVSSNPPGTRSLSPRERADLASTREEARLRHAAIAEHEHTVVVPAERAMRLADAAARPYRERARVLRGNVAEAERRVRALLGV